jgi:hypothetical protein
MEIAIPVVLAKSLANRIRTMQILESIVGKTVVILTVNLAANQRPTKGAQALCFRSE